METERYEELAATRYGLGSWPVRALNLSGVPDVGNLAGEPLDEILDSLEANLRNEGSQEDTVEAFGSTTLGELRRAFGYLLELRAEMARQELDAEERTAKSLEGPKP